MDRIAEETFAGVLQQVREKQLGGQLVELRIAGLKLLQHGVLLRGVQLGKRLAGGFFAVGVGVGDAEVVNLLRHQRQLVAHFLRRVRVERPLHIPDRSGGVRGVHLAIDKLRHAGFQRAGAALVGRDQPRHGRLDERPLFRGEEGRLVIGVFFGVCCGNRGGRGRQGANAAAADHRRGN